MDAFKCVNCNKIHAIKAYLINCKCGKGELNLFVPKPIIKEKIIKEEILIESDLTRKELISALKEKEIITSAKAVSTNSDDELREMLG